ncbi:DUF4839 domain-containing protein [Terrabacter sp. 2RAF25]|uniref:DUF4839 domain-containing protein n=1 Tax=Terrabacter sp. 2RAF25 TaxID=3232998 RepID=UPI003F9637AC
MAIAAIFLLALSACDSGQKPTMPSVVGRQLDVALQDIKLAGFQGDVDVSGGGVLGVIDKSNWKVCKQDPEPGKPVTVTPQVSVDRSCEAKTPASVTSSPNASVEPSPEMSDSGSTPSEPASEVPLTAKTSPEFKQLLRLTDQCSPSIAAFAEKYAGKPVAFDGSIVAMNNHGSHKTRYDILVNAGDFSATKAIPGPNFQFRDVNVTGDLNLSGPNVPDVIGVGDNLHVVAQVDTFESNSCLFLLEPVSTGMR